MLARGDNSLACRPILGARTLTPILIGLCVLIPVACYDPHAPGEEDSPVARVSWRPGGPSGLVQVSVYDDDGIPLAGVEVHVDNISGGGGGPTDADGVARILLTERAVGGIRVGGERRAKGSLVGALSALDARSYDEGPYIWNPRDEDDGWQGLIVDIVMKPGFEPVPCPGPQGLTRSIRRLRLGVMEGEQPADIILTPFRASRMWRTLYETTDLGGITAEDAMGIPAKLRAVIEAREGARQSSGRVGERVADPAPEQTSSFLFPLPIDERVWHQSVPFLLWMVAPLSRKQEWTIEDCALVQAVSDVLGGAHGAPRLGLAAGHGQEQQAYLASLARWYWQYVDDVQHYAHMICTVDEGPWRPVERDDPFLLEARTAQSIGESLILRLSHVQEEQPTWVLQVAVNGELQWSVGLVAIPEGQEVAFRADQPATDLGPYGFKVHLYCGEYVHLYLDRRGKPLFYFTAW